MSVDWQAIRSEFPALNDWTFLNTATFGQLSTRTTQAINSFLDRRNTLACSDFISWFDDVDEVRRKIGELIGARPEQIAFFPNSSAALGQFFTGQDWTPGDRVITLSNEFPNNLYACGLCERYGLAFVETTWDRFDQQLDGSVRAVLMSTVNYSTGFMPHIETLGQKLYERGIRFYLDATQSLGAYQLDVRKVMPSMLAVHGYKWMISPTGAAFAWVHPDAIETLKPAAYGWRSDHDWRNVNRLHHGVPRLPRDASRFESGMLDFMAIFGLGAAVDMMLEIGPATIEARVRELGALCSQVLKQKGANIFQEDTPILAAEFPGRDLTTLADELAARRILVSVRHGRLRVSPHFYNLPEDIETLATALPF